MQNERPFDLLNKVLSKTVLVRLKSNVSIRGRITSFDAHMNIVLEDAEELDSEGTKAKLGTILLRGGNIIFVSPA
ncbi:MAG TPA: LSm family protein [Candidatus Acidoferrum sp.]|nr:LSm family protein [Candidatus Acidoferrum sp.]